MKYKVAYYIESEGFGGAEQRLFILLSNIDRTKWEPTLIYHPNPGIEQLVEKLREINIQTYSLPPIGGWTDVQGFKNFTSKLKELLPAVFHAHLVFNLRCSYGIICARLAGIKAIVATQHAYKQIIARRIYKVYLLHICQKFISTLVDSYIAGSYGLAKQLENAGIPKDKIRIVRNGIYVGRYSNHNKNQELIDGLNIGGKKPVVLTVARTDKLKGHRFLIEAVTMVPEAVFLLAGDGSERVNFENQARELNIADRVIFLGQRNDIPELLSICDLFVLPTTLEGGLPFSILEAMSASKPVIGTNIDGVNELIIDRENGLLVPPADPEALADAIKLLLSDRQLAGRLAAAGRETIDRSFASEKMVKGVTDVYSEIIGMKGISDSRQTRGK